jgi:outer membrane lipoprotein-sorting protein
MKQLPHLSHKVRWAVPAAIVAAAGGLLAAAAIPGAAAAPRLPARLAGQLLAAVTGSTRPPPLSGTITERASLGLPALPAGIPGSPTSAESLLAGSHTFRVWYSGPAHYRVALPQRMSETDLVRNGTSAWLWDSSANTVTRLSLPAAAALPPLPALPLTPQQAARQALAAAGPTTMVRVDTNVTVAGQAAYQLVLAPKSPGSLVGRVRIAIDSTRHVPLRVQVFAKGATSPAAEIGFTAISFTRPPPSDYAFTPPAGATVARQHLGSPGPAGAGPAARVTASGVRIIGTDWLAVASLHESVLASLTAAGPTGSGLPFRYSSDSAAPGQGRHSGSPGLATGVPAGSAGLVFGALLNAARHVSGSWGSGRLLRTSLLSILVTSNGRVLIGAVTPGVLYHAATQAGRAPADLGQHTASRARPK